jgi:hypothetical protein
MCALWTDPSRTRRPSVPLLALCVLLLAGSLRPDELRTKAAVDLVFRANRYIFRFRPVDHVTPPGLSRIDALAGRNFGALDVYLYGKLNSLGQAYLGTRLDYTFTASEKRLQAAVQVRGFLGLNRDSTDHFYLITHVNYALGEKRVFRPGIMEYGIKAAGGDAVMYLGPALTVKPSSLWSLRLSYGYDVLDSGQLLYLKLYFYL